MRRGPALRGHEGVTMDNLVHELAHQLRVVLLLLRVHLCDLLALRVRFSWAA